MQPTYIDWEKGIMPTHMHDVLKMCWSSSNAATICSFAMAMLTIFFPNCLCQGEHANPIPATTRAAIDQRGCIQAIRDEPWRPTINSATARTRKST